MRPGALEDLTIGERNIAIGDEAGSDITSQSDNVLIGYHAGINTTSSNNVIIGSSAGGPVGASNVIVGHDAGDVAGLNNSILLGNGADGVSGLTTRVLNIGGSFFGSLANNQYRFGGTPAGGLTEDVAFDLSSLPGGLKFPRSDNAFGLPLTGNPAILNGMMWYDNSDSTLKIIVNGDIREVNFV